jgi:hypothetical protein
LLLAEADLFGAKHTMDSSQAPLISDNARDEELHHDVDDGARGAGKPAAAAPSLFVVLLTFAAGISGLLFGCWCSWRISYSGS